jgi:hypothetical protein
MGRKTRHGVPLRAGTARIPVRPRELMDLSGAAQDQ